jgi:malonyl-CoA/methylmalonyl-CoA synthetase
VNLAQGFVAGLEREPERVVCEGDGGAHTAGALAWLARRVAGALAEAGVRPGDRVLLCLRKSAWLPACHVGVLAAGAVATPLNPDWPDAALGALVARAEPALAIADADLVARGLRFAPGLRWWCPDAGAPSGAAPLRAEGPAAGAVVPRAPDDPALLVFTSGTTGTPKGVALSHGNLATNLDALAQVWAWTPRDRLLHVLPVFHLHGLGVALYGSLHVGSALVFHERFDAARVLVEAAPSGATLLMAVPTMLHRLLEAAPPGGDPLAGLRAVIVGSAALAPALFERFRARFGLAPVERYGMSETGMITSNPLAAPRPGRVGPPLPGVALRLRDPETGADAGRGPGEVQVRGPNVFAGYWRDEAATRAAFDGDWFRTGDLGTLGDDGALALVARVKELIVTGGYNVSPLAVERALEGEGDPRVAELAVAGVPDDDLGERVVAFVVPAPQAAASWPALEAALRARAEAGLPRYARPRTYLRVAALPRNALGKLLRGALARGAAQATGESPSRAAERQRNRPPADSRVFSVSS